jgi:hypothetical protein
LANFFVAAFLAGLPLFGPVFLSFLCFFLAFLLAIGAVYHRLMFHGRNGTNVLSR